MPRTPPAPDFLDTLGKVFWEAVAPCLPDGTLDKPQHIMALAVAANSYATYIRLITECRGNEVVQRGFGGGRTSEEVNANIRAAEHYLTQYKHYCKEFGLTPLSAEKLKAAAANTDPKTFALNLDED